MNRLLALALILCVPTLLFAGGQREGGNFAYRGITNLMVEGGTFAVEVSGQTGDELEMRIRNHPDDFSVYHTVDGSTLRVWVEKDFSLFSLPHDGALVFRVPRSLRLTVDNTTGDIAVAGISDTRTEVETSTGDIELEEISGEIKAHSTTGDVTIARGEGGFRVESTTGTIAVRAVDGDVRATSTTGNQRFERVRGDITARSSTGRMEFVNTQGALTTTTSTGRQTGVDVTLTGDSAFRASTGTIEMDLTNDLDDLEFDLYSTTGSLQVGGERSQRRLFLGGAGLRIEGETSTGAQRFR